MSWSALTMLSSLPLIYKDQDIKDISLLIYFPVHDLCNSALVEILIYILQIALIKGYYSHFLLMGHLNNYVTQGFERALLSAYIYHAE